jgi:hypothetical protein
VASQRSRARRAPLLTQPFEGGVAGWIVIFSAMLAELVGGIVTSHMGTWINALVLGVPVAVAYGIAAVQWWQVRRLGRESVSWWHLAGVAAAALAWWFWPTVPAALAGVSNARDACQNLPAISTNADCLHRAGQALAGHNIAWWSAAALIVVSALLTRKSRIAAWAGLPAALAGCQIASHFLTQLLAFYHMQ